jgi:O-6-methylguanine DNA methyltransferase
MTKRPERLYRSTYASPVGDIILIVDENEILRVLDFGDYEPRMTRLLRLHYGDVKIEAGATPARIAAALDDYFDGDLTALERIEWATGGTDFQRQVWKGLTAIPAGETESYGAFAARLGRPKAVRAVGLANGANPVGIVVPCHRVIGANGSMTGYGGGVERKRWLLKHEGALLA